ncbi:unnamed protein product [Gadus morhua 'NCC']
MMEKPGRVPGDPGSGDIWLRLGGPDPSQLRFPRRLPHVFQAFGFAITFWILVNGQQSDLVGFINQLLSIMDTLGAFLGTGIIFGMYSDVLWDYGQGTLSVDRTSAMVGIFAT